MNQRLILRDAQLDAMQELLQKQLQITKDRVKVEEFTGY
jgi:hypothetical protein